MLYREIIAVCSQIHTKHINTLCGQNVEVLNVKLAVHIATNRHVLHKSIFSHQVALQSNAVGLTVTQFSRIRSH